MKTVYIIVPVYCVEKYLMKCLDSIFEQTYKEIKVICVNDGSTDNSLIILENYKKLHPNLEIISKENGGLASARNAGLRSIKKFDNNYIMFVDSDDWIDCDYVLTLVNMIENNNVDIVCSSFYFATNNSSHPYCNNIDNDSILTGANATKLLILDETIQSHVWSKIYKLSLFNGMLFDESISYMEDQDFTYKLLYNANMVFITNYAGYYYRQDNTNALTKLTMNNRKVLSAIKAYYRVCLYPFRDEDINDMVNVAQNALVAAYLTLIPHYKNSSANASEKRLIYEVKNYIKENKLVKKYIPNTKENKIKKVLYEFCPVVYPWFFRLAKTIKSIKK